MTEKMLIIDGVRVRADEARQRGIHPEQIAQRKVDEAEAAEQAPKDQPVKAAVPKNKAATPTGK